MTVIRQLLSSGAKVNQAREVMSSPVYHTCHSLYFSWALLFLFLQEMMECNYIGTSTVLKYNFEILLSLHIFFLTLNIQYTTF